MKQTFIKLILCMVVALCSLSAHAQVKAFEKYADTKNVTYVFISKYMLGLAGKSAGLSVPGVDVKSCPTSCRVFRLSPLRTMQLRRS